MAKCHFLFSTISGVGIYHTGHVRNVFSLVYLDFINSNVVSLKVLALCDCDKLNYAICCFHMNSSRSALAILLFYELYKK